MNYKPRLAQLESWEDFDDINDDYRALKKLKKVYSTPILIPSALSSNSQS
jgi:hypothetical protein